MPYNAENFSLLGGYPGKQVFTYHTTDAIAVVVGANYFDQAVEDYNLTSGDLIIAIDTATPTVDMLVAAVAGTTATVTNGT